MGYDVMVGIAIAVIGIAMGWAEGPTNPFTTGIAQQMADLPMFSGLGLRVGLWVVLLFLVNGWILRYAKGESGFNQKYCIWYCRQCTV